MTEMRDRIARAMWEAREDIESIGAAHRCPFESGNPEIIAMAQAAMEAMREPTFPMLTAGEDSLGYGRARRSLRTQALEAWQAMIDAMLASG
jgi:hypothetical protein